MKIKISDTDPERAKDIANYWSYLFITNMMDSVNTENNMYLDNLRNIKDDRKTTYDNALTALSNFNKQHNMDLLKNTLDTKNTKLVSYEEKVTELKRQISIEQESYKEVTEQLKVTEQYIKPKQQITEESLLLLNKILNIDQSLESLTFTNEQINELYINLTELKNDLEQSISAAKEEKRILDEEIIMLKEDVQKLNEQVAQLEKENIKMTGQLEAASDSYQDVLAKYNNAYNMLQSTDYGLRIINEAVVPNSAISPNTKLNIAIAGMLALMLSIFIILFVEFMKKDDEEE